MVDASTIDIKIVAEGISEVLAQYKNLNDRIMRMEAQMQKQSERQTTASEKKKEAERLRAAKAAERIAEARFKKLSKEVEKEVKAEKTAQDKIVKDHEKAQKKMERDLDHRKNHFNHTLDHMARHAKAVAGELAAAMIVMGGGLGVGKVIDYSMEREKAAFAFSRQTEVPGKPGSRISKEMAKDLVKPIAASTGFETSKILSAGSAMLSGLGGASEKNNKLVVESLQSIVEYARAEGKDAAELAGEVGKMGKGLDLTADEIKKIARSALTHERTGGRTVAEMAEGMPEIRGAAQSFGGNEKDNIIKMMGISDLGKKLNMPAVPMGAFEKLDTKAIGKINAALAGKGIGRITDAHGKVVDDPQVVMQKVMAATGGDKAKIADIVGRRAFKTYDAAIEIFNRTVGTTKDKLAALAAAFHEENNVMASEEEEKRRLNEAVAEADVRFEKAVNSIKEILADHLQPHLEHFADWLGQNQVELDNFSTKLGALVDVIAAVSSKIWDAANAVAAAAIWIANHTPKSSSPADFTIGGLTADQQNAANARADKFVKDNTAALAQADKDEDAGKITLEQKKKILQDIQSKIIVAESSIADPNKQTAAAAQAIKDRDQGLRDQVFFATNENTIALGKLTEAINKQNDDTSGATHPGKGTGIREPKGTVVGGAKR